MSILNVNNCSSLATNESYFCALQINFKCLLNMVEGTSRTTQLRKTSKTNFYKSPEIPRLNIFAFRDNLALDPLDSKLNTVWTRLPYPLCLLTLGLFIMLCTIKTTGLPAFRMASTACSWLASLRSMPSTCNGRPQLNISSSYRTTEQFVDLEFWRSLEEAPGKSVSESKITETVCEALELLIWSADCGPLFWTLISLSSNQLK